MKKKLHQLLALFIVMVLSGSRLMAQTSTIDGITYACWNGTYAVVQQCADTVTHAKIKAGVSINGLEYPVKEISDRAFGWHSDWEPSEKQLISVEIPKSITKIGNQAFYRCPLLQKVTFPESTITSIGSQAFSGCEALDSIVLPKVLTTISDYLFADCKSLKHIVLPDTLFSIGVRAFYECHALDTIVLPAMVKTIGSGSFYGCTSIQSIELPDSLVTLGSQAFINCTALKTVEFSDSLRNIESEAFEGCTALDLIILPDSLSAIDSRAFAGCTSLDSIAFPEKLATLGSEAFQGCTSLDTLALPDGIKTIESRTFADCSNLSDVKLPAFLKRIEHGAFNGTDLITLVLPHTIEALAENAFSSSMSQLTCHSILPPHLEGNATATLHENIQIVFVPLGSGADYKSEYPWSSKVIVDGPGVKVEVEVTPGNMGNEILKKTEYLSNVNFLTLKGAINQNDIDNIKYSMPNLLTIDMFGLDMKELPESMFQDRKAILGVVLPGNMEIINPYAFINCSNLTQIEFPEGLKVIKSSQDVNHGNGTFEHCINLRKLTFPSTLEQIELGSFRNCTRLNYVEFNNNLKHLGKFAFEDTDLRHINLPSSLNTIEAGCFYGCKKLETVTIKNGLSLLGRYLEYEYDTGYDYWEWAGVFQECTSLTQVSLPNTVKYIGENTFSGCRSLHHINIPLGVERIGANAFYSCSKLKSINLPETLIFCSTTPFQGCNQLDSIVCQSILPAKLLNSLFTLEDMGQPVQRKLYVPECNLNAYKLAAGWAAMAEILPIPNSYPKEIIATNEYALNTNQLKWPTKPNLTIKSGRYYSDAHDDNTIISPSYLHLSGTDTLKLNQFTMDCYGDSIIHPLYGIFYNQPDSTNVSLLNEAKMTADSVSFKMYIGGTYFNQSIWSSQPKWEFYTFPVDVKLSDIKTDCDWVVRRYDGQARANCDYNNTWITVPYDSVLHAGEGYIWAAIGEVDPNGEAYKGGIFEIPAMDNENKNLIFADSTRYIPLKAYTSEFISNNGWNLIGNPYPCYYDTRHLDFVAPITVWDRKNQTYVAYSPLDDSYVLRPFEAFFVQRPAEVDSIGFNASGRQVTAVPSEIAETPAQAQARRGKALRHVVNLTFSNEHQSDRTRVVINDDAKMDYEMHCDAAKFMSNNNDVPQIYTVCNNDKYAINERPLAQGKVQVGVYAAAAGRHTIALQGKANLPVILVDLETGVKTDLAVNTYTYNAEAGHSNRFEILLYEDDQTTDINDVEALKTTSVDVVNGKVVVQCPAAADIVLYNAAGAVVATNYGSSATFNVAPGVYVATINGVSYKVSVVK